MKKKIIRLSESDVHNIILESVKRMLNESQHGNGDISYDMHEIYFDALDKVFKKYDGLEEKLEGELSDFLWELDDSLFEIYIHYEVSYGDIAEKKVHNDEKEEFINYIQNSNCSDELKKVMIEAFEEACEYVENYEDDIDYKIWEEMGNEEDPNDDYDPDKYYD